MPDLSRAQIIVYGAIGLVVLLLGAQWVARGSGGSPEPGRLAFSAGAGEQSGKAGSGGGEALVHVAGAVRRPGVYRLPVGSRVADAVERAGGPRDRDRDVGINLAARLVDGQQIVVPGRRPGGSPGSGPPAAADDAPISLGSATVEQLETIDGVGPVTAAAILDFRDERGGLGSIEELDEVSGIGPATLEALRGRLQP